MIGQYPTERMKLAEKLKDRADVNFFHFNVDLAQGPCVIKRLRGCGAGCEYVAVTPEGDIYPSRRSVAIACSITPCSSSQTGSRAWSVPTSAKRAPRGT